MSEGPLHRASHFFLLFVQYHRCKCTSSNSGDLSGSVQIVNVSSQISGLYRCSASNVLGTENCYVNLSIYASKFLSFTSRIYLSNPCDVHSWIFSAVPESSSGILQAVLLTLFMSLVLLALLVLVLWLHHPGQDGRWSERKGEDEGCYNEIRYTPSLMKRSFV